MYFHEIKKCFLDRLTKFRLENPLEFKELNVTYDRNRDCAQSGSLNICHNNERVFELWIADVNPKARSFPILSLKALDGSWISLHIYDIYHNNSYKFTFLSNLLSIGIIGRLNVTATPLLNEKCSEICSIFGIVLSSTLMPDDNIQLIAKFNIGDSINETI